MKQWNIDDISRFLFSRDKPIMEIDLLRHVTGRRRMPAGRARLFSIHFSLFHALYRLKAEAGRRGFYLHLDPMRIRLVHLPHPERCHYYFPDSGSYCSRPAGSGHLCDLHAQDDESLAKPSFDPLYEFYSNDDNVSFGKTEVLQKLMNGVIIYSLRKGEVQRALGLFGLSRPDKKTVQRKYRELAKSYHPDRRGGDESMMKELNYAYQILREVFVV